MDNNILFTVLQMKCTVLILILLSVISVCFADENNRQIEDQQSILIQTVDAMCGNHNHLPRFNPQLYNDHRYELTNNCYAFATMDRKPTNLRDHKLQPGEEAHLPHIGSENYKCSLFRQYVLSDHPTYFFRDGRDKAPCPCGYYKAALVITHSTDDNVDYHWYRQSDCGHWHHKPGSASVQTVDASGNDILDPQLADRDYSKTGGPNYSISCGYLCVEADPREMSINNRIYDNVEYAYVPPPKDTL
jgi:hypothetical protein